MSFFKKIPWWGWLAGGYVWFNTGGAKETDPNAAPPKSDGKDNVFSDVDKKTASSGSTSSDDLMKKSAAVAPRSILKQSP